MKFKTQLIFLFVVVAMVLCAYDIPKGWLKGGSHASLYDMGVDKGSGFKGKNAGTIRSIEKSINGFGTLMQSFPAGKYCGKRIRMTGVLRTAEVNSGAALWLRVDDGTSGKTLAFDNMTDRQIKGTTAWKKYTIVLDVPPTSTLIAFGALLNGTGQLWFDEIKFEIVSKKVPTTDKKRIATGEGPENLGFEE